MAVTTINVNDVLTPKQDGEVVTSADWNKLIALFSAINGNAYQLLDTIKAVDANKANILNISAGSVPDESITYEKLSKTGTLQPQYYVNTQPFKANLVYYTYDGTTYTEAVGLTAENFDIDAPYYLVDQQLTGAAIKSDNVIEDWTIGGAKLQGDAIFAEVCSPLLLGELLSTRATVYTNKAVSGTFHNSTPIGTTLPFNITLDKAHKIIFVINENSISMYVDTASELPDLHIGNYESYSKRWFYVRVIKRNDKLTSPPQVWLGNEGTDQYPEGLLGNSSRVQLSKGYYSADTKALTLAMTKKGTTYDNTVCTYGNLIIGI